MSPIAERLKEFISTKNLDGQGLSVCLGYDKPEKINRLFREKVANPSAEILADLTNKFAELNMNWLLTGKGEMLLKTSPKDFKAPERDNTSNETKDEGNVGYKTNYEGRLDELIGIVKSQQETIQKLVNQQGGNANGRVVASYG